MRPARTKRQSCLLEKWERDLRPVVLISCLNPVVPPLLSVHPRSVKATARQSRSSRVFRCLATYGISFLKVEDQVQLADVSKVPIENFYVSMYDFKRDELVVRVGDGGDEEQGGVAAVDHF